MIWFLSILLLVSLSQFFWMIYEHTRQQKKDFNKDTHKDLGCSNWKTSQILTCPIYDAKNFVTSFIWIDVSWRKTCIQISCKTYVSLVILSSNSVTFQLILTFRKVYNKELQDPEQPLLVHRPKDKELQRVSPSALLYLFVYYNGVALKNGKSMRVGLAWIQIQLSLPRVQQKRPFFVC